MKRVDQVDVSTLLLDPQNPRLPEDLDDRSQSALLSYLYDHDVLQEITSSYLANGYFESEPLIVAPADASGQRIVREGNRRLAALMIVLQLPPATAADIRLDDEVSEAQLNQLRYVPAVEAENESDVVAYLGFRHISGPKKWNPEAKARWIWQQVERQSSSQKVDPFYEVGRISGSNSRGVRNAYLSYAVLRYARDELRIEPSLIDYVLHERFGVWTRLLGAKNVYDYIGIERVPADYPSVKLAIGQINADRLLDVLRDLNPSPRGKSILADSRDVTIYSDVLADDRARSAMREYQSLELAAQIVTESSLVDRLSEINSSLEVLIRDISRYSVTEHEVSASKLLANTARALNGAIVAMNGDDE